MNRAIRSIKMSRTVRTIRGYHVVANWGPDGVIGSTNWAATEPEAQVRVDNARNYVVDGVYPYANAFYFEDVGLAVHYYLVNDTVDPPTVYLYQALIDEETREAIREELRIRLYQSFPNFERGYDNAQMVDLIVKRTNNGNSYTDDDQLKANVLEPKIAWVNLTIETGKDLLINLPTGPVNDDSLWPPPFAAMRDPIKLIQEARAKERKEVKKTEAVVSNFIKRVQESE